MSDPFGHLLTSLKEGNTPSRSPSVKVPTDDSNASTTTRPQRKKLVPLHQDSLIAGGSQAATIHDDFDDLFGSIPQKPVENDTVVNNSSSNIKANNDPVDDVFDIFEKGFSNGTSNNNLTQEHIKSETPLPQDNELLDIPSDNEAKQSGVVVDEVKDMEIAKLMSIGLSIERANKYYDNGILYEDVMKKRHEKQKKMMTPKMTSSLDGPEDVEVRNLFDKTIKNSQRNNGDSLTSWATGLLNKGKDIVNQLSTYPEEENERLRKFNSSKEESSYNFASSNDSLQSSRISTPKINRSPSIPKERLATNSNSNSRSNMQQGRSRVEIPEPTQSSPTPPLMSSINASESDISYSTNQSSENQAPQEATLLDFDIEDKSISHSQLSVGSTNSIQLPSVAISEIELSGYNEFKTRATEYFQKGDYSGAVQEYEKSLNTLPQKHPLRVIAYSNIIASRIKIGEHSKSISDANDALELFPTDRSHWSVTIQNSNPARSYKDIWPKILMRLAESYEAVEKYKLALEKYQTLLENNVFNDKIIAGKRRCQHALGLDSKVSKKQNSTTKVDSPKPVPKKKAPSTNLGSKTSENSERVKRENERLAKLEDEKVALYDQVDAKIASWTGSNGDDIRFLLSNLQSVLTWCDWKPVAASDLVMPKKVKITYMKAVAKTHPDKIQSSLELENQMIAERIFSILSKAWEKFRETNDI